MFKISNDLRHIGEFVGHCFGGLADDKLSTVAVQQTLDDADFQVDSVGRLVGSPLRERRLARPQADAAVTVVKDRRRSRPVEEAGRLVGTAAEKIGSFIGGCFGCLAENDAEPGIDTHVTTPVKISNDLKHIGEFVGHCFGGLADDEVDTVAVQQTLDDADFQVDNVGRLVGSPLRERRMARPQADAAVTVVKDRRRPRPVEEAGRIVGAAADKIGSFIGGCFGWDDSEAHLDSAVAVHTSLRESDFHVESIGHLVGSAAERVDDFLSCAASDIEDSFSTIGKFISVEHLPPTPCVIIGKALCYILHEHLNGSAVSLSPCASHA